MRIKTLAMGAVTAVLLSAPLALAQTAPTAGACANPPCPAPTPPKTSPDPSTEPVSADPMATPADKGPPRPATTTGPSNQPPPHGSSSMPASDLPKGTDPGSPTAPSPMPGSR